MTCFIGIDISARTFTFAFAVRVNGKTTLVSKLNQTPEVPSGSCEKTDATASPRTHRYGSNRCFHFNLAVALTRAGLPVCVINPATYHHYATMRLSVAKTDARDAVLLAESGKA